MIDGVRGDTAKPARYTAPEPPAMPEPLAVPPVVVMLFSMAAGMELQRL
jgi:hypothetical protein